MAPASSSPSIVVFSFDRLEPKREEGEKIADKVSSTTTRDGDNKINNGDKQIR